jgi:hypothetical protein
VTHLRSLDQWEHTGFVPFAANSDPPDVMSAGASLLDLPRLTTCNGFSAHCSLVVRGRSLGLYAFRCEGRLFVRPYQLPAYSTSKGGASCLPDHGEQSDGGLSLQVITSC